MNNFKKDGFRKGGSQFGGKPRFGGGGKKFGGGGGGGFGRPQGDRELFKATCDACRTVCEVPFRPSGDKPVYCRECFGKDQDGGRGSFRNDSRESDFKRDARPQRNEQPHRHEEPRQAHNPGIDDLKRQITSLESKVEHLIDLVKKSTVAPVRPVAPVESVPAVVVKEIPKKTAIKKVAKVVAKTPTKAKEKAPAKKSTPKKAAKKTK